MVGSLNLDVVARVDRLPRPGETVLGVDRFEAPGGKGANQAVAAARLGRRVAMVGRVGVDGAAETLLASLHAAGVDTSRVIAAGETPTGLALITLAADGENTIVVIPGANHRLAPQDVEAAGDLLDTAAVVLVQLEVLEAAVDEAVRLARGTVILNPAPARSLPRALLARVDVLVPNETELAHLADDSPPVTPDEVAALAVRLTGPRAVVVTMGAGGALVVDGGDAVHVPAPQVEVVDTTAAGDTFCAGLADGLAGGAELVDAARWAVHAAAVTVTRPGAQPSLPTRSEVEELMASVDSV